MKTSILRRCALQWMLLLGLGGSGCGGADQSTLILSFSGLTNDIHTLWLIATMAGTQTVKEYPAAPMIGLRLRPGASGQIDLVVGGLSDRSCWVATSEGSIRVDGEERVDVSVQLGQCTGLADCCTEN